jgi:hypothetical protein
MRQRVVQKSVHYAANMGPCGSMEFGAKRFADACSAHPGLVEFFGKLLSLQFFALARLCLALFQLHFATKR